MLFYLLHHHQSALKPIQNAFIEYINVNILRRILSTEKKVLMKFITFKLLLAALSAFFLTTDVST